MCVCVCVCVCVCEYMHSIKAEVYSICAALAALQSEEPLSMSTCNCMYIFFHLEDSPCNSAALHQSEKPKTDIIITAVFRVIFKAFVA